MDLKKSVQAILEAVENGVSTLDEIIVATAYSKATVKKGLKTLVECKLVDQVGNDEVTIYLPVEKDAAPKVEQEEEEQPTPPARLPHLRKLDFLKVQENDKFNFRNKEFTIEEIIQQKAIAGQPFLKMIAKSDEEIFEITVNVARATAPISLKQF